MENDTISSVSSGFVCSLCWKRESPSHILYCKPCNKLFCDTCVADATEKLKCPLCGRTLAQFRPNADQNEGAQVTRNITPSNGSASVGALTTWCGLSPKLAEFHRNALMKVSFGAFLGVGICAAICNSLARIVPSDGAIAFMVFSILCSVYQVVLLWRVFVRRNRHFGWHKGLEFALLKLLREKGGRVAALTRLMNDAHQREFRCSNAVFAMNVGLGWFGTALFVIGAIGQVAWRWDEDVAISLWIIAGVLWGISALIGIYIAKRLTQDFFYHEQREDDFLRTIREELQILGIEFSIPLRKHPLKKRHFWLYLFIYAPVTLGLFAIYWVYVIFRDPHRHFSHQHLWEANLLPIAPDLAVPEAMPTDAEITALCGGAEPPASSIEERLRQLLDLRNKGMISEDEYEAKRKGLIEKL